MKSGIPLIMGVGYEMSRDWFVPCMYSWRTEDALEPHCEPVGSPSTAQVCVSMMSPEYPIMTSTGVEFMYWLLDTEEEGETTDTC